MSYDSEWHKKYYIKNKEKIKNYQKERRAKYKDIISQKKKEHYQKNKDKILGKNKLYRQNHKNEISDLSKQYYSENKNVILQKHQEYRDNNSEMIKEMKKADYNKNKEHYLTYRKKYYEENRGNILACGQKRYQKMKIKLFNIISNNNIKCAQCGCTDIRLLEINHINGGGKKEMFGRRSYFIKSILNGERKVDDLEILCRVCNAKHYLEMKYGKLPYKIYYDK